MRSNSPAGRSTAAQEQRTYPPASGSTSRQQRAPPLPLLQQQSGVSPPPTAQLVVSSAVPARTQLTHGALIQMLGHDTASSKRHMLRIMSPCMQCWNPPLPPPPAHLPPRPPNGLLVGEHAQAGGRRFVHDAGGRRVTAPSAVCQRPSAAGTAVCLAARAAPRAARAGRSPFAAPQPPPAFWASTAAPPYGTRGSAGVAAARHASSGGGAGGGASTGGAGGGEPPSRPDENAQTAHQHGRDVALSSMVLTQLLAMLVGNDLGSQQVTPLPPGAAFV